jgi:uncharacterized protein (DUF2384 family)
MDPRRQTAVASRPNAAVLTKALLRAAQLLAVPQRDLGRILGVSASSMSRLARTRNVDPESKEGELALLFLRVYRSLDALMGGREESCRAWFHAPNAHLAGVPADLVQTVPGLVHVAEYLDAMRGKL